jgi:DNA repair protein RadC
MNAPAEIRVVRLNESPSQVKMDTPAAAAEYWRTVITAAPWFIHERELCVVLALNTRLMLTGHSLVSMGSLNESIVHPREVFRPAVALNAYAAVLMHNHPSGDPSPSDADRRITRKLSESGRILSIELLDHVIIGEPGTFSFREAGIL